jgi:hypothetical protein
VNRYRRNPGMSLAQLAAAARQMGKANLAALLERGGPAAEAVAAEINAAVDAPAPAPPNPFIPMKMANSRYFGVYDTRKDKLVDNTPASQESAQKLADRLWARERGVEGHGLSEAPSRASAPSGLSDREAWLELASLVPRAFSDQPEPVQRAIVEAFRAQAA